MADGIEKVHLSVESTWAIFDLRNRELMLLLTSFPLNLILCRPFQALFLSRRSTSFLFTASVELDQKLARQSALGSH